MKKILFIAVCFISVTTFTSGGSTAPCGLSENTKEIQFETSPDLILAEAIIE